MKAGYFFEEVGGGHGSKLEWSGLLKRLGKGIFSNGLVKTVQQRISTSCLFSHLQDYITKVQYNKTG